MAQTRTPSSSRWEPLTVVERTARLRDDGVELLLELSGLPDTEWCHSFSEHAASREPGSGIVGSPPEVVHDIILWTVPKDRLSEAWRFVMEAIEHANIEFEHAWKARHAEAVRLRERLAEGNPAEAEIQAELDSFR